MLPRWLWCNHVPPGLTLTFQQQAELRRIVRELSTKPRRYTPMSRRIAIRLIPGVALLAVGFALWLVWLVRVRPSGGAFIALNLGGILTFQALLWIVIMWAINRAIAPVVWQGLNRIGVRVCEGCGYILEALPQSQSNCPECGGALHPATESPPH